MYPESDFGVKSYELTASPMPALVPGATLRFTAKSPKIPSRFFDCWNGMSSILVVLPCCVTYRSIVFRPASGLLCRNVTYANCAFAEATAKKAIRQVESDRTIVMHELRYLV